MLTLEDLMKAEDKKKVTLPETSMPQDL